MFRETERESLSLSSSWVPSIPVFGRWIRSLLDFGLWVVDGRVRLLKETEKSPKQQNMENPPHTHTRGFYSFFSCGVKTHEEKGKIETKTHGGGCTRRKKKKKEMREVLCSNTRVGLSLFSTFCLKS
jgi:hypothetical protein